MYSSDNFRSSSLLTSISSVSGKLKFFSIMHLGTWTLVTKFAKLKKRNKIS